MFRIKENKIKLEIIDKMKEETSSGILELKDVNKIA